MFRKKVIVSVLACAAAAAGAQLAVADQIHLAHTIAEIQPPQAGHDCVYFRLNGVTQADPAVPGSGGYFAMPRAFVGFREVYALLLSAYHTGTNVSVRSTGAIVGGECGGYVGINWVITP